MGCAEGVCGSAPCAADTCDTLLFDAGHGDSHEVGRERQRPAAAASCCKLICSRHCPQLAGYVLTDRSKIVSDLEQLSTALPTSALRVWQSPGVTRMTDGASIVFWCNPCTCVLQESPRSLARGATPSLNRRALLCQQAAIATARRAHTHAIRVIMRPGRSTPLVEFQSPSFWTGSARCRLPSAAVQSHPAPASHKHASAAEAAALLRSCARRNLCMPTVTTIGHA